MDKTKTKNSNGTLEEKAKQSKAQASQFFLQSLDIWRKHQEGRGSRLCDE
jgi:hypothetical protein